MLLPSTQRISKAEGTEGLVDPEDRGFYMLSGQGLKSWDSQEDSHGRASSRGTLVSVTVDSKGGIKAPKVCQR